jgi:NADPH:quinone reductase-like Zn-dependent oxidoreductase
MRAVTLDAVPAGPTVSELPDPRPEAGELLVRVAASSINGFDAATIAGYVQGLMEHRFPLVPGKDFAGTVAAVGDGVTGFAEGDQVFGVVTKPFLGAGSLAQYVTVSAATGVARVPGGLSVEQAGSLGLAGTAALDGVTALAPAPGETVLVSGATGGVGAFAVQLLAARGASVIATARIGEESEFVRGLADAEVRLVDHTGDVPEQVRALVPSGVDAVLHLAGDGPALAGVLRPGGRIASTLGVGPDAVGRDDVTAVAVMADATTAKLTALADAAASGELRVPATATYPLDHAPKAFADFGAGALGKLAITID